MRKSQSVRHYARPSLALVSDDLGVLREGDESNEDVLRKQLLEKDRECDRLKNQVQELQNQLSLRPPLEQVQAMEKEYRDLDLLLQGTQRENERCMSEMERGKVREKMLERELARLAGDNWQASLDFAPSATAGPATTLGRATLLHQRSNTSSSFTSNPNASNTSLGAPISTNASVLGPSSLSESPTNATNPADQQALAAHVERVKLLVLGMEQRLTKREEALKKQVGRAEAEGRKFEKAKQEMAAGA